MKSNAVVDRTTVTIGRAADRVAASCGPRTRALVAVRNLHGVREWLDWAVENTASPDTAAVYMELATLVGLAPRTNESAT
jgi:hypothetical protein